MILLGRPEAGVQFRGFLPLLQCGLQPTCAAAVKQTRAPITPLDVKGVNSAA